MSNFGWDDNPAYSNPLSRAASNVEVRPLMRQVYLWMTLGLLLTAGVSAVIAANVEFAITISRLFLPIFLGQLAIVFGLSWAINRIPANVALGLFFVYAGTLGLTLGAVFFGLIATGQSYAIANAFLTTAGLFGTMTVVGYTTKVDLSKYSTFFMMAMIGLFIAMIVNFFLASSALDFIISVVGVLIFTALTAYDTQRIKQMAAMPEYQQYSDSMQKLAVLGALTLYLDFINIFIFLLQLFSGRD